MNLAIPVPSGNLTQSFIEKVRKTFKQEKVVLLPEKQYKEMLKAKPKMTWNEFFAKHPPFADFSIKRDNAGFRNIEF